MMTTLIGQTTQKICCKTPKQIKGIKGSCSLAASTLVYIKDFVKEGVTTLELNDRIDEYIRKNGGLSACLGYNGFTKSCCISVNDVVCHGIPDSYKLKNGDILNIDVATILDGYFGDTSKMYTIGEVSPNAKRLLKIVKDCLNIGISQCYPNLPINLIGYEIERYAKSHGFSVVKEYCGHGVGLELHEYPPIPHTKNQITEKLRPGMVITIEPILNEGSPEIDKYNRTIDKKLSAQLEHTVLITRTGHEILT